MVEQIVEDVEPQRERLELGARGDAGLRDYLLDPGAFGGWHGRGEREREIGGRPWSGPDKDGDGETRRPRESPKHGAAWLYRILMMLLPGISRSISRSRQEITALKVVGASP